jgi:DNA-binding Lrp family transcriptional regulator
MKQVPVNRNPPSILKGKVRAVVFNATLNNISAISWRSVLLAEKPEYPEKTTDLPQVIDKLSKNRNNDLNFH